MVRFHARSLAMVLVFGAPGALGCGGDGGDDGDTWVAHRGGVVCKGAAAVPVAGSDVYVAPSGSDDAAGDRADRPLASLARALCNAAPGQTVHVAAGTYEESVLLSNFAQPGDPIHIVGEVDAGGARPVLDGGRTLTYGLAFIGEDASHRMGGFVVEGLERRNYTDAAILAVNGDDLTIRDVYFHHNGFHGINPENNAEGFGMDLIEVVGLVVEASEGAFNGPEPAVWERQVLGNDLAIWGSQHVMVRGNYTHDGIGGGLLVEDCVDASVEGNRFNDAELDANGDYWDGAIWVDGGHDIRVTGNTFEGNHGPAIEISDEGVTHPEGYVFEDNTIRNNLEGVYIWNFGVCPWPDETVVSFAATNTFDGNTNGDHRCSEWECGVGVPCD